MLVKVSLSPAPSPVQSSGRSQPQAWANALSRVGPHCWSTTWSRVTERSRRYLEPTESGVEVVEGQDAVVNCQEAEEPGGAD